MMALPVVGGINRVVQTYLHPHAVAAVAEGAGAGSAGVCLCGLEALGSGLGGLGVELGCYGVGGLGALEAAGSHALESGGEEAGGGGGVLPPPGLPSLLSLGAMPSQGSAHGSAL